MENIDTLIKARWVIPIEPLGRVLEHHAVAIRAGRIVEIGPAEALSERFCARQTVDRPRHVLLPGFVNAHTHSAMTLLRGFAESGSHDRWLADQVRPLERRWVDAEYVRDGTTLAIIDMLTSGTTCFGDSHLFPEVIAQVVSDTHMRACVGLPVLDHSTAWAADAGECLEKGLRLHDEYRDDPLIKTCLAPYSADSLSDDTLARVRRAADELELPMVMHVNQTAASAYSGEERTIARLERLGLMSALLTAVHMVHVDEAEIDASARAGISVVHCPQANLKLGTGISPVALFKTHDIHTAIGTDSPACNNDLSMLDETRTAALLSRGIHAAHVGIDAHEWLRYATLNGARALGLGDEIGSLTPNKWADLCCIDLERAHTQPVYDPAAQLVFSASREQVSDVWVAGRPLISDSQLLRLDVADAIARAQRWQARIASGTPT